MKNFGRIFIIFFISAVSVPLVSFCQPKEGSVEYLKYSNGINGIILGADISTLSDHSLTHLNANNEQFDDDSCIMYAVNDTALLKMPDNLSLDQIGIRTYKNKIVDIYLFFKTHEAYKMLSNMMASYGLFTEKPVEYADIYNWNTRNVSLSLRYQAKDLETGVAIYTNNTLAQEIAENRELADAIKALNFAKNNNPFSITKAPLMLVSFQE